MKHKLIQKINQALGSSLSMRIYKEHFEASLHNKIIKINFLDLDKSIFLHFQDEYISILEHSDKFDVEIAGKVVSFIFYSISRDKELYSSKINISGDIESANSLNKLIKNTQFFRAIIFELLGENLTSTFFSFLEPLEASMNKSNEHYKDSLSEFLKYDINVIPTKEEVNKFLDDVDDIKSRTERLRKKIL